MTSDFIFECKKCLHRVYATNVLDVVDFDCPSCGEEFDSHIWILIGIGDFVEDYGDEK